MLLHQPGRLHSPLSVRQDIFCLQKSNARLCAASAGRHLQRSWSIAAQPLETLHLKAKDLTPDVFAPFGQVQVARNLRQECMHA